MKKILKWVGVVIGGLVGLLVLMVVGVYLVVEARMNQTIDAPEDSVAIPSDPASLELGKHVAEIRGCTDCHGENLAGGIFLEDPMVGRVVASNLTAGRGGVGAGYTDADWVRAIRYGATPEGKPLLFMPSNEFWYLSDRDLGAVIAFAKSVPPVDHELPGNRVALVLRAFYLLTGDIPLVPVEDIDLEAPRPPAPEPGVTVEYGRYLAVGCIGCHGEGFSGGPIPGTPPDWPPAPNLTPGGELAEWTEAEFIQAMRTGVSPHGHEIDNEYMPWQTIAKASDDELKALFLFLGSLPAREFGNR